MNTDINKMNIETKYNQLCNTPSDINEHLPTLKSLASMCDSVCELGVRGVISSYAILNGLNSENNTNKLLWMNDLTNCNVSIIKQIANSVGISLSFTQGNDLTVDIPESVDMSFIDTWHVYGQLKRELDRYAPITKKIIAMHDTTVDGVYGETIRNGWNAQQQSIDTGIPVDEINKGLLVAVEEFLENNDEWCLVHRYTNNNGLTVLARKEYIDDVRGCLTIL